MKEEFVELKAGFIVINPIPEIQEARKNRNYFLAFILAVSHFEYYGYRAFKIRNLIVDKGSRYITVTKIIKRLKKNGLIDESIYKKMQEVKEKRNELVHPKCKEAITMRYIITKNDESLLDKAIQCIEALMSIK